MAGAGPAGKGGAFRLSRWGAKNRQGRVRVSASASTHSDCTPAAIQMDHVSHCGQEVSQWSDKKRTHEFELGTPDGRVRHTKVSAASDLDEKLSWHWSRVATCRIRTCGVCTRTRTVALTSHPCIIVGGLLSLLFLCRVPLSSLSSYALSGPRPLRGL
jgi:hypothetical protein